MSWDLYFIRFRGGANAEFDPKPSLAVVEKYCVKPVEPPFRPFLCELADGLTVELYIEGLDGSEPFRGPMISLRGYTEATASFLYDLAKSGDMTILNTGDPVVLLTDPGQREQLPPELRDDHRDKMVVVDSAASLHAALTGGYEAWREYRDHVVKGQ